MMQTATRRTSFGFLLALGLIAGSEAAARSSGSGGTPTLGPARPADLTLREARPVPEAQLPTPTSPLPLREPAPRCEKMIGPNGQPVLVGPGCNGSDPAPGSGTSGAAPSAPAEGCPGAFFPAHEQFARETRFAFPIEERQHVYPEPFIFHMDHDPIFRGEALWDQAICEPYEQGRLCYDNHQGTDFALIGSFAKMDEKIHVVAAADGYVMSIQDGHPDRCSIDTRATLCDGAFPVCSLLGCVLVPTGCVPNPRFGEVVCPEGEDSERYEDLGAVTNFVEICHADGTVSRYLHLMKDSTDHLAVGRRVDCGERIGLVGSSGRSSAPHLHFDVYMWTPEHADEWDKVTWIDPYTHDPAESLWTEQYTGWVGGLPGSECQ